MRTFSEEMRAMFGCKVWKLSVDAGFSCPNRDGTAGTGGCGFCCRSSRFSATAAELSERIEQAKALLGPKGTDARYALYFQNGTNTYGTPETLRQLFLPAAERPDLCAIFIGTRPDCLDDDRLAVLQEVNTRKPLWVELGLQTANDRTAADFNRGYPTAVFDDAMNRLRQAGIRRVVHAIAGLPGETPRDLSDTADHIAALHPEGVKLHMLHILAGTPFEARWRAGEIPLMTLEEYVAAATDFVGRMPPETVIHRLTGDGDKRLLLAPLWTADKKRVLNALNRALA